MFGDCAVGQVYLLVASVQTELGVLDNISSRSI